MEKGTTKKEGTYYILSALFLIGGIAFNWFQFSNSVNDSLSKSRAEKKRKAEARKEEMEEQAKEIDEEIKEIIKK